MVKATPKILKLSHKNVKYCSLPSYVDSLLAEGVSLRVVASKVRVKYDISMSYESVRRYRDYVKYGGYCEKSNEESDSPLMIVRPIKKKRYH